MNKYSNDINSFEELLQTEAEGMRAYPNERVWQGIHQKLHTKNKWRVLPFVFFIIVSALTIITALNYPPKKLLTALQPIQQVSVVSNNAKVEKTNLNINKTFVDEKNIAPVFTSFNKHLLQQTPFALANTNIAEFENIKVDSANSDIENNNKIAKPNEQLEFGVANINKKILISNLVEKPLNASVIASKSTNLVSTNTKEYLNNLKPIANVPKQSKHSPWLIQYYATISNSYRTLEDDKNRLNYFITDAEREALGKNVNDVVRHKPAVGAEFGAAAMFGITKNLFVKGGLQFNIRQYGIDAYRNEGDARFTYIKDNAVNSYTVKTAYSTQVQAGAFKASLENQIYQLSAPIGLQWNFIDDDRIGVSLGATVQPTFTFNKNVYVVSTDYKYYADGTNFFRRFNVNTSAELLFTIKGKEATWFVGPQIRHQQLPTYNDLYPIKEYRVDYGIKFGFIKNL